MCHKTLVSIADVLKKKFPLVSLSCVTNVFVKLGEVFFSRLGFCFIIVHQKSASFMNLFNRRFSIDIIWQKLPPIGHHVVGQDY